MASPASKEIIAAGVVLLQEVDGERLVAVLHRPTHLDWSLPKGKLDSGEHIVAAARRETIEETGCDVVLGMALPTQRYRVEGRRKSVRYWVGLVKEGGPGFSPNAEIDELQWLPPAKAARKLSYPRDVELVTAGLRAPATTPLIIMRHAQAIRRADWGNKRDELRPLGSSGVQQAEQLSPVLRAFGISEIHSSSATRCIATVTPFANDCGLGIDLEPDFGEDGLEVNKVPARRRILELLNDPNAIAVCSHRPVLPVLVRQLAKSAGLSPRMSKLDARLPTGGFIVLHRTFDPGEGMRVVAIERHAP